MSKIKSKYTNWGNWYKGTYDNEYTFEAKVFQNPSQYGIDNGQVSKLFIKDIDNNELVAYERGWDLLPQDDILEAYNEIVSHLESRPLAPYDDELERMRNAVIPFRT